MADGLLECSRPRAWPSSCTATRNTSLPGKERGREREREKERDRERVENERKKEIQKSILFLKCLTK